MSLDHHLLLMVGGRLVQSILKVLSESVTGLYSTREVFDYVNRVQYYLSRMEVSSSTEEKDFIKLDSSV